MKTVTSTQMREFDRLTIEDLGVPGEVLMDRAGRGVADVVREIISFSGISRGLDPKVLLVAGSGNNGGDAFVAARYLNEHGFDVELLLAAGEGKVRGDALVQLDRMKATGVEPVNMTDESSWKTRTGQYDPGSVIVVDGVLGTGISGPVKGAAAHAVRFINQVGAGNPVVSIDVPSGMNADTGMADGDAVVADYTVTMGFPKRGLLLGTENVGSVKVLDIGIPHNLLDGIRADLELNAEREIAGMMRRRGHCSHKGIYGHVLIVGGAPGYSGAVGMAAMSALRSGAGLVTVLAPASIAGVVAGMVPEAMVHPGDDTESGSLSDDCLELWGMDLRSFDAILIGPGMTTHEDSARLVRQIVSGDRGPIVVDADALNVCAGETGVLSNKDVILTPHPGEMARLLGISVDKVQEDRVAAARSLAEKTGAVTVLKGAGTVVLAPGMAPMINMTGNPGMATGGSGDVLGGLMAGLVAQGMELADAARAAVYIHGRAGDIAALVNSQAAMITSDIIRMFPPVFLELTGR